MERRKLTRQRTLIGARLEFNNLHSYDCVVSNITAEGAYLKCSGALHLPAKLTLVIPTRGERHTVNAVWRSDRGLGVSFVEDRMQDAPVITRLGKLLAHTGA